MNLHKEDLEIATKTMRHLIENELNAISADPNSNKKNSDIPTRVTTAFSYIRPWFHQVAQWLGNSNEITNFTYALTPKNIRCLTNFISHVSGVSYSQVHTYIQELQGDKIIRQRIQSRGLSSSFAQVFDEDVQYGRRLGWYALARIYKPRVIVETGVEKGLGAVVLCNALLRNTEEGFPGQYLGTDINPEAGFLLSLEEQEVGKILIGDSITSLENLKVPIDLFISDSDHSEDYEAREYQVIQKLLSPKGIIISDNAHVTDQLLQFSIDHARKYLFWQEYPDHWYPGAGIGISWL